MRPTTARLIAAALVVLGATGTAAAQIQVGGFSLEGDVEAGWRFLVDRPSKSERAKFEEYRDNSAGPLLADLRLRLFRPDESYAVELGGSRWGYEDQEFSLRAGRLGLWDFGFEWDQTRHVYSTNARLLAVETGRGVWTLPTPRPALVLHNAAPELDEISTRWDTAKIHFTLTPTPDLELTAAYTRIRKDGDRPIGIAFGSPGNNFYEVLEPIEQTIHDFRLRGAIARERWQLQFGYGLSVFQNDLTRLVVDNPCLNGGAAVGCSGSDVAAAAIPRGQTSLPPDNMAHTFTLAGGVNLPMRTRVNASLSYSLLLQNDDFLPHTINPAFAGNPDLVLPQRGLNGNVQVFLVNVGAVSRPLAPLTLSAKYRLYDYNDFSDVVHLNALVQNDRTLLPARRAGRWSYARHNTDLDARWQLMKPLALTVGGGWERWDRSEHREVMESDEIFAKAAADWTPFDWLQLRASYKPSFRRIENYNTRAHLEHSVFEDAAAATQGQSLLLRKFDQGERDRHRVDLLAQIMPTETLTLTPTFSYRHDDYVESVLGLQKENSWAAGMDVSWAPVERLSLSSGYVHERTEQRMRSRSRPVVGGIGLDFADFDWVSELADTVDTFYGSLKAALIPKVLDLTFAASYAIALGRIETSNPVTPASSTAGNNATATAKPMPAFEDKMLRLETALRYHFAKSWTASLLYVFESFEKTDWRTDQLNPFVGISSIYLGNDLKDYTAHIVGATLRYRFR